MRTVQGSYLQSLRGARTFIDTNAAVLPNVAASGARKRLDVIISELEGYVGSQSGSKLAAEGATKTQNSLRRSLVRDHMTPIAKIAAADLPPTPALEPLKMLRGRPSAERLHQHALGMASAATPFKDVFITAGLPLDFLDQLTAAADAMLGSFDARKQLKATRKGATLGLKNMLSKGRRVIHALDAMVRSALKDDPALLEAWNSAMRVEKVPGGAQSQASTASTSQPAGSQPAAPAPAAPPAPAPSTSSASAATT